MNWKGVIPAITTNLKADLSVDHEAFAAHCRWMIDSGCTALVCCGSLGEAQTLIFDEIDAGVGGRAAVQIGRRLARLARTHQVIVVTHLPQVAAYADTHLVVDSGEGASEVRRLDDDDRVAELARMLAGLVQVVDPADLTAVVNVWSGAHWPPDLCV